jgi:hypothetical protein
MCAYLAGRERRKCSKWGPLSMMFHMGNIFLFAGAGPAATG